MAKSLKFLVLLLGLLMAIFCQDPSGSAGTPSNSGDIQENTEEDPDEDYARPEPIEQMPYSNEELMAMTLEERKEATMKYFLAFRDRVAAQQAADRIAYGQLGPRANPNKIYLSSDPKKPKKKTD